jgi:hypothetical protein
MWYVGSLLFLYLSYLCMAGAALLAALALCDHSVTGAVPPRCQMHRVVVFLSGLPSVGPGGMPHAMSDAAEELVLTQVLAAICSSSLAVRNDKCAGIC